MRRVLFDFSSQPIDVRIDGVFVAFVAQTPNAVEQLRARVNAARMAREKMQQIELFGGQVDDGAAQRDAPLGDLDSQFAAGNRARFIAAAPRGGTIGVLRVLAAVLRGAHRFGAAKQRLAGAPAVREC